MRNKRLDILRCIAVLSVMILHGNIWPFFGNIGWVGVDLFFVLSGFLISGLLFSEYKTRNSISFKRFFIRRGLKIYPAFYFFLAVTYLYCRYGTGYKIPDRVMAREVFFFLLAIHSREIINFCGLQTRDIFLRIGGKRRLGQEFRPGRFPAV